MNAFKLLVLLVIVGFVISFIPGISHCDVSRERGSLAEYAGSLRFGTDSSDRCDFSVSIERVIFLLTVFENKYKVIRIRVENRSANSIQLSSENDSIVLKTLKGEEVRGLFKLQEQDAPLWDSLDKEMREALAYPQIIRAGRELSSRREIMYFFAFFPKDQITKLPLSFYYKIDSLPEPIEIKPPPVTAK